MSFKAPLTRIVESRAFAIARFAAVHLACFAAIWTGIGWGDLALFAGLYAARMFGITGGYHRYFAHKSFKTSRPFAFILAVLAQSSAQTGVIWWAAKHRDHHRYSDTERDIHSPVIRKFWYAHVGWIFEKENEATDYEAVPDLSKYPELVWLDRHPLLPAVLLGAASFLVAGWSGLVVGFVWSTVALWHSTFAINSVAHVVGRQRYLTGDQSRNNWWLALLTFGEGWHNNHHHYQSAARQGFRWWEVDITYYILRVLAAVGLIWELHQPPAAVVRNERRLGRATIEKAARQLAESYSIEPLAAGLAAELRQSWEHAQGALGETLQAGFQERLKALDIASHDLQEHLATLLRQLRDGAEDRIEALRTGLAGLACETRLAALPTRTDIANRARQMFVPAPSTDAIIERAREIIEETVAATVIEKAPVAIPIQSNR